MQWLWESCIYVVDFVLHLDTHLQILIQNFGAWTYGILFLIIFAETGLVITPFLPGDSLLFTIGTFAAMGSLKIEWIFGLLSIAAIAGDSVNYAVGKFLGEKAYESRYIKKQHIEKTHRFYEKYGAKTIVIARFVPIVRTFAPFVAGVGKMTYAKFLLYNVFGGILWVSLMVLGGYFFGNIPIVKQNFSIVVLLIIFVSILPILIEFWRHQYLIKVVQKGPDTRRPRSGD